MKILIVLFLAIALNASADYTEFYINNAGGGNTNSGHTADASPTFSAQNGFWTNYTGYGVFFKAGMTLTAVTNGAWAAVYTNDSTATAFVGIITNVDDPGDFIFVKTVEAKGGTAPTQDDANGKTHITVGGAWLGPGLYLSGATATVLPTNTFPCGLMSGTMTNNNTSIPCFNIKGGTTYSVTNALTVSGAGPIRIQGYTTTIRDGGKAVIDGGTANVGYILLTHSGASAEYYDMEFSHNGNASASTDGVSVSGLSVIFKRCIFHDFAKNGVNGSGVSTYFIECEAYKCNYVGTVNVAGFANGGLYLNCISHDNKATALGCGFAIGTANLMAIGCISYANGSNGFVSASTTSGSVIMIGCDVYSNGSAGLRMYGAGNSDVLIQNCNFVKNSGAAITNQSAFIRSGFVNNCGFGSGTQTNDYGMFSDRMDAVITNNLIIYTADTTPWNDPTTGDFRLTTEAKAKGRASFVQSTIGSPLTIGYPDIGAAQNASTNAAAGTTAHTFAQ